MDVQLSLKAWAKQIPPEIENPKKVKKFLWLH